MKLLFTITFVFSISILTLAQTSSPYTTHESIGLSPTAFSLQKGEKRITNTWGVLNNFTHGITDKFSYSVALTLRFDSVNGLIRAKYTHDLSEYLRVGFSPSLIYSDSEFGSDVTGIVTLGSQKSYINFSYSRFYSQEEGFI